MEGFLKIGKTCNLEDLGFFKIGKTCNLEDLGFKKTEKFGRGREPSKSINHNNDKLTMVALVQNDRKPKKLRVH